MAVFADALTAGRAIVAFLLMAALATDRIDTALALLCLAWITDYFDGLIARRAADATRFPNLDLPVDTLVGAGALIGSQTGGYTPLWLSGGVLVVFGGAYVLTRNATMSMVLQAFGYGAVLFIGWSSEASLRWLPFATIPFLLVMGYQRFTTVVLPLFFEGFRDAALRFNKNREV